MASAVAVPTCVAPSNSFTVDDFSAVPVTAGVGFDVVDDVDVMTGAAGAVVSTVIVMELEAGDTFPAASVAVAVIV